MGSIVSKLADEIALHGSWEAYCEFQNTQSKSLIPRMRNPPPPPAREEKEPDPEAKAVVAPPDPWESARTKVAHYKGYDSFLELIDSKDWGSQYYRFAAEIMANEAVKAHGKGFHEWVDNQVIAGRTTHKLWLDYWSETPLPFPDRLA